MSRAQQLPILVLERVFDYVLCSGPDVLNLATLPGPVTFVADAVAVAGSCKYWRKVILGKIFMTNFVESTFLACDSGSYRPWFFKHGFCLSLLAAIHIGVSDSIRSVFLYCNLVELQDGTLLEILRRNDAAGNVFRLVSTVHILIGVHSDSFDEGLLHEITNVEPFCDAVERAFPAAATIHFSTCSSWTHPRFPVIDQLYSRLLKGKTRVRTESDFFCMEKSDCAQALLRSCQPLRELKINGINSGSTASEVIRRHAGTLEHLHICGKDGSILNSILLDVFEQPVSYPRLLKLTIYDDTPIASIIEHLPPGHVSFPALEYVDCNVESPEFIEYLLQSNGDLLKSFHLNTSIPAIQRLTRKGVFGKKYPAMKHIRFSNHDDEDAHDTVCAALRLGRNASTISVTTRRVVRFNEVAPDIASLNPDVRELCLPELTATVEETLRLVKAQPLISRLVMSFTLSEAQREVFDEHTLCVGGCIHDTGDEAYRGMVHGDDEELNSDDINSLIRSHIDVVCAESDYLEDLFPRLHPVSERLVVLEATFGSSWRLLSSPMERFVSLIHLMLLCPSIRTVYCGFMLGTYTLHRSDFQAYASFKAMEGRLLALVSHDNQ